VEISRPLTAHRSTPLRSAPTWGGVALIGAFACTPAAPPELAPSRPTLACAPESAQEISVVTYNVHGLAAWIAGDDPAGRMPSIGRRLSAYDLVLVQEDFRYHDALRAQLPQHTTARGNSGRWGQSRIAGLLNGAGLAAFARVPPGCVQEIVRTAYEVCSGWIRRANDCLASKGVLGLRIRLSEKTSVDVYTTHLDAGVAPADLDARQRQLEQLATQIERTSTGRAVIVAGDFNLADADPTDRRARDAFVRRLGLRDSGAKRQDATRWPTRLDYLFYRSGEDVGLERIEAGEALEFVTEGGPLSDHPALFARFAIR